MSLCPSHVSFWNTPSHFFLGGGGHFSILDPTLFRYQTPTLVNAQMVALAKGSRLRATMFDKMMSRVFCSDGSQAKNDHIGGPPRLQSMMCPLFCSDGSPDILINIVEILIHPTLFRCQRSSGINFRCLRWWPRKIVQI